VVFDIVSRDQRLAHITITRVQNNHHDFTTVSGKGTRHLVAGVRG